MFTGIIEQIGTVKEIAPIGSNITFTIEAALAQELKIDQSVAHNGVCLTVISIEGNTYKVTAIDETLGKTTLAQWTIGQYINLERGMIMGSRLDGHIVLGHTDTTAVCTDIKNKNGSNVFTFTFEEQFAPLLIEKGSICVDGISLTAFDVGRDSFSVAIIPYTLEHTTLQYLQLGQRVNIEFDVTGKYIVRGISLMGKDEE